MCASHEGGKVNDGSSFPVQPLASGCQLNGIKLQQKFVSKLDE